MLGVAAFATSILSAIVGMAGMFLPIIAFGLLIAFLVTALLCRWLPNHRTGLYVLAGAAALLCIHLTLHQVLGLTPVAAARSAALCNVPSRRIWISCIRRSARRM